MITPLPSDRRGLTELGWLHSRHSFSFGQYHNPEQMGFRALRVINDDIIAPSAGFDTHPHRDMEIITWVLAGSLQHRDSIATEHTPAPGGGGGGIILPGQLQRMSAGTGITHSEFNPSDSTPVHLLQMWIFPDRKGHATSYDQREFTLAISRPGLTLLVSPDGREGSVAIHRDAFIHHLTLATEAAGTGKTTVRHPLAPSRHAWVQVTQGALQVNGVTLHKGDGCAISDERELDFTPTAAGSASALLFDLD